MNNKVIIITGEKGEGKTTKLLSIINLLNKEKISTIGFTAKAEWEDGERNKYTLDDINSNNTITMCSAKPNENYSQYGRFYFNPLATSFGNNILSNNENKKSVIVIDEVGPFELDNKLWHKSLIHNLKNTKNIILISVRETLVKSVINKYNLNNVKVFTLNEPIRNIISEIKLIV